MKIIAEIGHNHNGNIDVAKEMIASARQAGAWAAKFQLYDTDKIKKPGETNYQELKRSELDYATAKELYHEGLKRHIPVCFSVFDDERLEWALEFDAPFIKIAQRTAQNRQFVQKVIAKCIAKNRMILISGKSFSTYPQVYEMLCLSRREILIAGLDNEFIPKYSSGWDGWSDHAVGMDYMYDAADAGLKFAEKHFTLNKNWPGWDMPGSMLPEELFKLTEYIKYKGY